jgi:hypothetical protein
LDEVELIPLNFVLSKFWKNVIQKNVQSRSPFERTLLFDQKVICKNDRWISKERYSILQPTPKFPFPFKAIWLLKKLKIQLNFLSPKRSDGKKVWLMHTNHLKLYKLKLLVKSKRKVKRFSQKGWERWSIGQLSYE